MPISYDNEELREYCASLINANFSVSPFESVEEIMQLRSILADLKSASCLSDTPVVYNLRRDELQNTYVEIDSDNIRISCLAITSNKDPGPLEIKRLKIIKIVNLNND